MKEKGEMRFYPPTPLTQKTYIFDTYPYTGRVSEHLIPGEPPRQTWPRKIKLGQTMHQDDID